MHKHTSRRSQITTQIHSNIMVHLFSGGIILGIIAGATGIDSWCTIESKENKAGKFSCEFTEDIADLKYDFQILRYASNSPETSPERILDCNWVLLQETKLMCDVIQRRNYTFDWNVSKRVELHIPRLTSDYDGSYKCVLIPPDGGRFSTCDVISDVFKQTTFVKYPGVTDFITETPQLSDQNENREQASPGNHTEYIIGIAIVATVAFVAIVAVIILYRRRDKKSCFVPKTMMKTQHPEKDAERDHPGPTSSLLHTNQHKDLLGYQSQDIKRARVVDEINEKEW